MDVRLRFGMGLEMPLVPFIAQRSQSVWISRIGYAVATVSVSSTSGRAGSDDDGGDGHGGGGGDAGICGEDVPLFVGDVPGVAKNDAPRRGPTSNQQIVLWRRRWGVCVCPGEWCVRWMGSMDLVSREDMASAAL